MVDTNLTDFFSLDVADRQAQKEETVVILEGSRVIVGVDMARTCEYAWMQLGNFGSQK
jgi:hypothetical protein